MKLGTTRNILITGASSGIGYQASLQMVKKGINLCILCRDNNRIEYMVKKLEYDNIQKDQIKKHISFYIADLSDLNSIQSCIKNILNDNIGIDTMVLNAGLQYTGSNSIRRSSQNIELTFAVNHLSHHMLVQALLPILIKSNSPRVVITASEVHNPESPGGKIGKKASLGNLTGISNSHHFQMIDGSLEFNADKAYKDSKLCNILFGRELYRRLSLKQLKIPVICWAPGLVIPRSKDGFFRYSRKYNELGQVLFAFIARDLIGISESVENAGKLLMKLALSDEFNNDRFLYMSNKIQKLGTMIFEEETVSKEASDSNKAKKLWNISNQILTNLTKITPVF